MKYLLSCIILFFCGCDTVYHYVMFPPQRVDFVLVPDSVLTHKYLNQSYIISSDKKTISYDGKDYKIEIKYMSDYQLNTFEFPEQSVNGYFSTNPFTYGNWIDPTLGYTPNRFTVFKVSIYNYTASKINFDPENCFLETERGDKYNSYGREEKNSRYLSLEAYYKKRKGSSGVDDDVFESRMGIIRRTVHYLGKPVFRNDTRDGLIVFDPLSDDAGKVKLTIKDFILGYDENNQPSEFVTLNFYFDRTGIQVTEENKGQNAFTEKIKTLSVYEKPTGMLNVAVRTTYVTPIDKLMQPFDNYASEFTNFKVKYSKSNLLAKELAEANILLILGGEEPLTFLQEQESTVANYIRSGGFIIADVFLTNPGNRNWAYVNQFFGNVAEGLNGKLYISRIPSDHIVFNIWKKFESLPAVDIELYNLQQKEEVDPKDRIYDFLMGLYYENKLVGILSNRGYSIAWGEFFPQEFRVGKDYTRQRELLSNILYYASQIQKK